MGKPTYNPCDDCVYGINRRDGNGSDSMSKICEFTKQITDTRVIKTMTNYELIKNMTIEELAVTIACPNETGMADIECDKSDNCNYRKCCLEWLNSEVAE